MQERMNNTRIKISMLSSHIIYFLNYIISKHKKKSREKLHLKTTLMNPETQTPAA